MPNDDDNLTEKTFGKIEATEKVKQLQFIEACFLIACSSNYPEEIKNKASKLHDGWIELNATNPTSPKEQQAKTKEMKALIKRIAIFLKQSQ